MSAKITIGFDKRNKNSPHCVRWWGDELDFKTGRLRCYCSSFRTKAEAKRFAAEKRTDIGRGIKADKPSDTSLEKFFKDWLFAQQSELAPASLETYEKGARLK